MGLNNQVHGRANQCLFQQMCSDLSGVWGDGGRPLYPESGHQHANKKAPPDHWQDFSYIFYMMLSVADFHSCFTLTPHRSANCTETEDHERPGCGLWNSTC